MASHMPLMPTPPEEPEEAPPFFASWRGAYTAVLLAELVLLVLIALLSAWPY
jgi:hypothetical protein